MSPPDPKETACISGGVHTCIAQNVPLPRRASKSVYMSQDGIKLVIELGHL
jgi:hypothetical protein